MMNSAYYELETPSLDEFDAICAQTTDLADYPMAQAVVEKIVVYDGVKIRSKIDDEVFEQALRDEFARCLNDGPGVFMVRGAYDDLSVIDRCTETFRAIVAREKVEGDGQGDHFGNNERIWNSLQKIAEADADVFIAYYGNPILGLASEAWLGPHFQMTAQMNNVKPGGKAQSAHRDYHLGFQSRKTIVKFPAHAQVMSQYLTLQGAIAHCDMPVEKGPTLLLPYSQQFRPGVPGVSPS